MSTIHTKTQNAPEHETAQHHGRRANGYLPLEDYALIGNLRTAALVSLDGSIDSFCYPYFDSPSVFARLLDNNKGGHFLISPKAQSNIKQQYLPNTAIVQTMFLSNDGVVKITDFMPRPAPSRGVGYPETRAFLPWLIRRVEVTRGKVPIHMECLPAFNYSMDSHKLHINPTTSPTTKHPIGSVTFESKSLTLELMSLAGPSPETPDRFPEIKLERGGRRGQPSEGVFADFVLERGEIVHFVLREPTHKVPEERDVRGESEGVTTRVEGKFPTARVDIEGQRPGTPGAVVAPEKGSEDAPDGPADGQDQNRPYGGQKTQKPPSAIPKYPFLKLKRTPSVYSASAASSEAGDGVAGDGEEEAQEEPDLGPELMEDLLRDTSSYWDNWIGQSKYAGRWREYVQRSAITLKLLTFEPTGAIVAAPTFSLPEDLNAGRNWDYRFTWIRDASFTLYALIRLGFTEEANAFMEFWQARLKDRGPDAPLQIVFTIHGGKDLEEKILPHLEGYRGATPVRIGNGAADHLQLDVYGELMDSVYLFNKYGKPCSWEAWADIRLIVDYVCDNWDQPDMSIWEVRGKKQNFVYSKVMCWVAIDRGIRLSEKRSLPCPNRAKWYQTRDRIYEEVQEKGWNEEGQFYAQSYEQNDVLDSAMLIMPLTFFISPSDPRFVSTLKRMLKTPDKGGLTDNSLVYRYDFNKSDDGVGGEEAAFAMTSMWMVEALTRAGQYDKSLLVRAVHMFEEVMSYANHVYLFSEEISPHAGQSLGNTPQAFTHVSLISAAYNPDRVLSKKSS